MVTCPLKARRGKRGVGLAPHPFKKEGIMYTPLNKIGLFLLIYSLAFWKFLDILAYIS
jgi:hypothetical protein